MRGFLKRNLLIFCDKSITYILSVRFRSIGPQTPISAAEHDILAGASKLNNHIAQLTIVTSGAYSGSLEPYLIRSESRMMHQLSSNMVCLNIKLAQYIIGSRRISFKS